ncbi:MAG: 3-methyl-2-oxobutanoate hydroxymethyltransferase [Actinocrinis sp.]
MTKGTMTTTAIRPTLLSSCAYAATAAEARFRINAVPQTARQTRVVALDPGAAAVIRPLVGLPWRGCRFLTRNEEDNAVPESGTALRTVDGTRIELLAALDGADFVMMVATANDGAKAAAAIGFECFSRGVMTAAIVLGDERTVNGAVNAVRPHARVLLVSSDQRDVEAILSAVAS